MRKNSDFLQFRPYHAFTAHAAPPAAVGIRWRRAVLIVGTVTLLLGMAAWFTYR